MCDMSLDLYKYLKEMNLKNNGLHKGQGIYWMNSCIYGF